MLLNFIPISARCTAFFYLKALLAIISLISSFSRRRQIGVAALIFPVIPHEDNIMKQTWSTSWCWYILCLWLDLYPAVHHAVVWLSNCEFATFLVQYLVSALYGMFNASKAASPICPLTNSFICKGWRIHEAAFSKYAFV